MLKFSSSILLLIFTLNCWNSRAQEVKISTLPFNKSNSTEMAPCFTDSTLIFASDRKINIFKNYFDQDLNLPYQLYSVKLLPDSTWSKAKRMDNDFNIKFNNGPVCFSPDKNSIFFTRNHYDTYKRSQQSSNGNGIGIYESEKNSRGNWSRPKSLPINSRRDYNTGHPTLSADGNTLYFVSDMANGYGEADIFYSEKVNGEWGEAINLGKVINTPGAEVYPYFHAPTGRLYFASNGHLGEGGLDIFYSMQTANGWSDPVNMGEPYNSPSDDYAFTLAPNDDWGFFTSNRKGSDNIYRADPQFPSFDNILPQKEIEYCGSMFEKKMQGTDTIRFSFTWDMGDGTTKTGFRINHCFPGPGSYHVTLRVVDTEGLVTEDYVSTYDLNIKPKKQIYISCPDTVKVNDVISFTTERSAFGDFDPYAFYWNFGDGFKTKGRSATYIFREKGIYTISCGATSLKQPGEKMCNSKLIVVTE